MSRHEIEAFDPQNKVIVGWDHPMQTFFAQVINRKAEAAGDDDKFELWEGCSLREIYDVDDLAHTLRHYAKLSPDMRVTLHGDKDDGL